MLTVLFGCLWFVNKCCIVKEADFINRFWVITRKQFLIEIWFQDLDWWLGKKLPLISPRQDEYCQDKIHQTCSLALQEILLKNEVRPFQSLSVSWGFWFVDLARLIQKAVFRAAGLKTSNVWSKLKLISPSAAYIRQWIGSALVQIMIMAWRPFGTKPLS